MRSRTNCLENTIIIRASVIGNQIKKVNEYFLRLSEMSGKQENTCLVSCSVLKDELTQLVKQGNLYANLVFVSKYFHVDYAQIEKNLRSILGKTIQQFKGNVILVYGGSLSRSQQQDEETCRRIQLGKD